MPLPSGPCVPLERADDHGLVGGATGEAATFLSGGEEHGGSEGTPDAGTHSHLV